MGVLLGAAASCAAVAVPAQSAPAAALDFPFETGFSTAAGGTLSGDAAIDDGWLRLTDIGHSEAGSWSMDHVFPSNLGLEIEFRYATWGGDGADGVLLSLADGSVPSGVGQTGGALGYSCDDSTGRDGACDRDGLPGAWIGLALDEYGNFSRSVNGTGTGQEPDTVALRGSGNGTQGYRFLRNAPAAGGTIATGSRSASRMVRVTIQPDAAGVLRMTARSDTGPGTPLQTILDGVPLDGPEQAALPPTLRLGFAAATGRHTNRHEIDSLRVTVPTDLHVTQSLPEHVVAGNRVRYTATVGDDGRNDAAPSAVHIAVPPQLHDVTWSCIGGPAATCGDTSGAGNAIDTTVDLGRGGSAVYMIEGTAAPDATGAITSTATITPPASRGDTDETDNVSRVRAEIRSVATLTTDKSVALPPGTAELLPGDEVEYTVTARNDGPSTARQVGVQDNLPDAMRFVASTDGCRADGQQVTCASDGALAPGERHAFRFRAALQRDYEGDGSDVVNIATATSPDDPDGGDPSNPVPLPPVRSPHPAHDDGGPAGGTSNGGTAAGTASDGAGAGDAAGAAQPDAAARPRALAYTGAAGLAAALGITGVSTAAGLIVRSVRRRTADGGAQDGGGADGHEFQA